tara:strand:+ start:437 stop:916 length:480 start_codon:yes stop_codon:yes gene_type:complete
MAKLNIEELVSGLLEAALTAQHISERQHINSLRNYFDDKGNPKTTTVQIGEKSLNVPLYILADHSSIGLDKLDVEFDARLLFGDDENKVSDLKKGLLGIFKKKGHKNNIKEIRVDSDYNPDNIGAAKIKVSFKADKKPEMVSRLIDSYISTMDEPNVKN